MTPATPTRAEVEAYNEAVEALPNPLGHPCLLPRIVHEDDIEPNDYNPNKVPDPELEHLEQSIRADRMTMPIVAYERPNGTYEIVDGFHRYHVLTDEEWMNERWVPISVIDKELAERMESTVRHNRARGDHTTELMGELVEAMRAEGKPLDEIAKGLNMEREELLRLQQISGVADELAADTYGQAWGVQDDADTAGNKAESESEPESDQETAEGDRSEREE